MLALKACASRAARLSNMNDHMHKSFLILSSRVCMEGISCRGMPLSICKRPLVVFCSVVTAAWTFL
eukprot:9246916-Prorocentrum_lima.AAC.1